VVFDAARLKRDLCETSCVNVGKGEPKGLIGVSHARTWIELARGLTREFTKWSSYCMMTSNISANPAE